MKFPIVTFLSVLIRIVCQLTGGEPCMLTIHFESQTDFHGKYYCTPWIVWVKQQKFFFIIWCEFDDLIIGSKIDQNILIDDESMRTLNLNIFKVVIFLSSVSHGPYIMHVTNFEKQTHWRLSDVINSCWQTECNRRVSDLDYYEL